MPHLRRMYPFRRVRKKRFCLRMMIPEFRWNLHSNQVILENLFIYQKFFLDERVFL